MPRSTRSRQICFTVMSGSSSPLADLVAVELQKLLGRCRFRSDLLR
jgi:hypothetical protein